jgi:transposase InsO family protein
MILEEIAAARDMGARLESCCECVGLDVRTVQRWRQQAADGGGDRRRGPKSQPANTLSPAERAEVLATLTAPEFAGESPNQVVPKLADMGIYLCSESTMYRLLRGAAMLTHRSAATPSTRRRPTQYEATGPNQVWAWDITYLRSPIDGCWYYLYMIVDVWSRYIVGWRVEDAETSERAAELMLETCTRLGIDADGLVLHSDNGGPMTGSTMLATLQRLGVVPSFSRPSVSDDNAFAEALFRTCKYRPGYPHHGFVSLDAARAWVENFVRWYNEDHQHSAIRFVTPDDRHFGHEGAILANRRAVYERARARNSDRWSGGTRNWNPIETVILNPRKDGINTNTDTDTNTEKRQAA